MLIHISTHTLRHHTLSHVWGWLYSNELMTSANTHTLQTYIQPSQHNEPTVNHFFLVILVKYSFYNITASIHLQMPRLVNISSNKKAPVMYISLLCTNHICLGFLKPEKKVTQNSNCIR